MSARLAPTVRYLAGLERAGFVDVQLRYEEGNMALWSGTNPVAANAD
jgi:hypothetical protein